MVEMTATLTTKNYVVRVEPMNGQDLETLVKKVKQIYSKRSLQNGIIEVIGNKEIIYKGLA